MKCKSHINVGAYELPFSGVVIEYSPLNTEPEELGLVLHESGYLAKNSDWNFPSVYSPFWRLYYNFEPGHCVVFGDRMFELRPERMMLIPDSQLFHCLGKHAVPSFWLAFSVDNRLVPDIELPILLEPCTAELTLIQFLCALIEANEEYVPSQEIFAYSKALLRIVFCRREFKWMDPFPKKILKAEEFMKKNISNKISANDIARAVGLSRASLYRLFENCLRTTPIRHLSKLRLRFASHLLLDTEDSIEAIAVKCGLTNRNYFSRVFHKYSGEWPGGFRNKHSRLGK